MAKTTKRSRVDVGELKRAASGRWPEILTSVGGIPVDVLDGQHHPCPKCGGEDRFRLIDKEAGALFCNGCFSQNNGDGVAAVQWAAGVDFLEAANRIAEHLGIKCQVASGKVAKVKKAGADKDLEWTSWSSQLVKHYLAKKPGISEKALLLAGAKLAKYRGFTVIAFPIIGKGLNVSKPCGWAVVNCIGETIPTWNQKGSVTGNVKIKILPGSKSGLFGAHAVERLKKGVEAEIAWKVEGLSDLLALLSIILETLHDSHLVISNSCGTGEKPKWQADVLAANDVNVIHDCDDPGQLGAARWAGAIAACQADDLCVKNVQLPFGIEKTKGKDLRDWIAEGNDYDALLALAEKSEVVEATEFDDINDDDDSEEDEPGLVKVLADLICQENHFARDLGGKLYRYSGGVYRSRAEQFIQQQVKSLCIMLHETKAWSVRLSKETVAFISVDAPYLWDKPPLGILNVANGLIDLAKGELLEHTPEHLSPIQLPVRFDPDAKCPDLEKFVSQVFPEDATSLSWEVVAMMMTADTSIQKSILLLGAGGNGKSTWLAAVSAFLGSKNISAVSLHRLESDRFSKARLLGKLANICADLPTEHLSGTSVFKALTGGDAIEAERKFHDSFQFVPFVSLVFSANSPPRSQDASEGFFDRWAVVPFDARFRNTDQEITCKDLDARLSTPSELSGLLNRAIEAWHVIQQQGRLSEPESVKAAWREFHSMTDPMSTWLDQFTIDDRSAVVTKEVLRTAYGAVCEQKGRQPLTSNAFGRALSKARPDVTQKQRKINGRKQWCYVGICLGGGESQGEQEEQESPYLFNARKSESEGEGEDSNERITSRPISVLPVPPVTDDDEPKPHPDGNGREVMSL